jgi:hypothetical protein
LREGRREALEVRQTFCGGFLVKIPSQDIFNEPLSVGAQALGVRREEIKDTSSATGGEAFHRHNNKNARIVALVKSQYMTPYSLE